MHFCMYKFKLRNYLNIHFCSTNLNRVFAAASHLPHFSSMTLKTNFTLSVINLVGITGYTGFPPSFPCLCLISHFGKQTCGCENKDETLLFCFKCAPRVSS